MTRRKFQIIALAVLAGVFVGRSSLAKKGAYEFFDTIVDVRSEIVRHYVESPDETKMLEGSIKGMIETLNDPYTDYFNPESLEAFDKQTRATFSGIGAEIDEQDGHVTIVSPLEDSPAFKAGVLAGDIILEIDGKSADGLKSSEAVKRITGPEGSKVKLKLRHTDGKEVTLEITRQRIHIQTVRGMNRNADHHWNWMIDPDNGVAYIRLMQFSDPTADALKEAIKEAKAKGMKGLILDLRFNPGGLLDQAVEISNMFLPEGKRIVSTKGRNSPERVWTAEKSGYLGDFPLVVMVNEFSASASEILSGALKDNERGIVLGTRSFGKGSVQQVMALESGAGAIKVTTAYYYLPSGRNIHRREGKAEWGVDPNDGFYIPMSTEQMRKMNEVRRSSDVLKDVKDEKAEKMTPEYVSSKLSDPQLAGALKAIVAKIKTGDWQKTGMANAALIAHVTEQSELEKRREALQESLDKVNQKLKELDGRIANMDKTGADVKSAKAAIKSATASPKKAATNGDKSADAGKDPNLTTKPLQKTDAEKQKTQNEAEPANKP
jgi:carboxyl-terminal processing protease